MCWLVSTGIKSLEMIQLQEIRILWSIRQCVCNWVGVCVCVCVCVYVCVLHMQDWVSSADKQPLSVFRHDCFVCMYLNCVHVHLQTLCSWKDFSPGKKASFLCNTCADVYKKVIHMLAGEFFVLPINSGTCPRNTIRVMTVAPEDSITYSVGWVRRKQKQPAANTDHHASHCEHVGMFEWSLVGSGVSSV